MDQNLDEPFVSIIIPFRNEEQHLAACLDSVLGKDYPSDRLEILLIDGKSTDGSPEIARGYAQRFPNIRLLDNPRISQAPAMNTGFLEAKGEIIVRMDAHATYASDYISRCVHLLQTTEAENVGGTLRAVGTNYMSRAIAIATTTPFGAGDAFFRFGRSSRWVDTVFPGAWRKNTLKALGGWNEELGLGEDYELNYRLRKSGGRILLSPDIRCWYYVRRSLRELARQYWRYGFRKVKVLVLHPDALRWRHLVPPFFVVAFLVSLGLLPFNWRAGVVVPGVYLIANLTASLIAAFTRSGARYLPVLPFVFATLHLSYGAGFLAGPFTWGVPNINLKSLVSCFRPKV